MQIQKWERGRQFSFKIRISSYGDNHQPLHLDKWSLVRWKIAHIHTDFIPIIILFDAFKCGDDAKFRLFWGGNRHWNILCLIL
jgi:hypothetical protein